MANPFRILGGGGLLLALLVTVAQAQKDLPRLERHGNVEQLIVEGKPFLILGGELYNSSSSSLGYMQDIWPRLVSMHLNTVLAPVAWETVEPREGQFDFQVVDGLIDAAHQNNLHLVFLWFGSWKNTYSSYVPDWVKRDVKRFPRVQKRNGEPTERLSPFSVENRNADAKAFATLMKHIATVDSGRTVLMVQVENEVGTIPDARDYSSAANEAFASPVPQALMQYLEKNSDGLDPALLRAWVSAGKKTNGTWRVVFGDTPLTSDLFMAWHYATYIDAVASAGKAEYKLPMYANAALIRPNYQPGQYNSGGPLPHSMDIYRAGAPDLDFVAPDIYFDDFGSWASRYRREGNPLFVPEARGGNTGAANALYAFGALDAIGFSPFGIDGTGSLTETGKTEAVQKPIASAYAAISHLTPLILQKQSIGETAAMVLEGEAQRAGEFELGGYRMMLTRSKPGSDERVAVLFVQTGEGEFQVIGAGDGQVAFAPASDGPAHAGILSIDEEVLVSDRWVQRRRLNGDENGQGQVLRIHGDRAEPAIYHLRLYGY